MSWLIASTGPLFTKQVDLLLRNLMKSRSHEIVCYNYHEYSLSTCYFPIVTFWYLIYRRLSLIISLVVSVLAAYNLNGDLQMCIFWFLHYCTQITASGPRYLALKFLSKYFKDISDMKNRVICDWSKITRGDRVTYHWNIIVYTSGLILTK